MDWRDKDRNTQPRYEGPTCKEILEQISAFGSRKFCSYDQLLKQYGTINESRLMHHLTVLVNGGRLREETLIGGGIYYYLS